MTMGTTSFLYCCPDMGAGLGFGTVLGLLGHFAVWCRESDATMPAPRWLQLRINFLGKRRAGDVKIGPIKIKGQRKTDFPGDFIALRPVAAFASDR
jgi:hypothetical protein